MKIANIYSHLNGLEFLMVHKASLWEEIKDVITCIDADDYKTKESKEKTRKGQMLYSPGSLNTAMKEVFNKKGWKESVVYYYVNEDLETSRQLVGVVNENAQKDLILSNGYTPFHTYNQVDFVKDGIAVEVQFGKYFSVQYDLHVKHTFFYSRGDIDVGIEIIPTHAMMKQMSSGIAWYENELMNIVREGRSNPSVPIVLIGIEP